MSFGKTLAIALAATLAAATMAAPAFAQRGSQKSDSTQSQMLRQLYLNGQARIARGDPAGAAAVFEVTSEVAPELPQMHYSLALAQVLADFERRERALPAIGKALAADPAHPLYNLLKVMADPRLSSLEADGSLALTQAGAALFQSASASLGNAKDAVNSRYLAPILASAQASGGTRLAGFAPMLGAGGKVQLKPGGEPQAFGRLLTVAIPEAQFSPYEARMVARLQNGLESLTEENMRRARIRARLGTMKDQMSVDPSLPRTEG